VVTDHPQSGHTDDPSDGPVADGIVIDTDLAAEVVDFPDAEPAAGRVLTMRQHKILQVIRDSVERRGYPPSVREIGQAAGLKSPSSVAHQLKVLEKRGLLRRDPNRPRAVDIRPMEDVMEESPQQPTPTYVPVVGRIAAGGPILAEQAIAFEDLSTEKLAAEIRMAEEDVADAATDSVKSAAQLKLGQLQELQRALAN